MILPTSAFERFNISEVVWWCLTAKAYRIEIGTKKTKRKIYTEMRGICE